MGTWNDDRVSPMKNKSFSRWHFMRSDMLKAGGSVTIRSDKARTYDKLIQSSKKEEKKKERSRARVSERERER